MPDSPKAINVRLFSRSFSYVKAAANGNQILIPCRMAMPPFPVIFYGSESVQTVLGRRREGRLADVNRLR